MVEEKEVLSSYRITIKKLCHPERSEGSEYK